MKICRFNHPSSQEALYGRVEGEEVLPLSGFSWSSLMQGETISQALEQLRTGSSFDLSETKVVAPVSPSKIVCVGRNYAEHAAELGNAMPTEPLLFLKAPSAILAHQETILLPPQSERVEHEGELGVVIGRRARNLQETEDALSYVLGYTCLNDVTARDLQRRDVQFTRGKSFDTFCPVGPFIITDLSPADLRVQTRVNGEIRQDGRTSAMAFTVAFLIRYISQMMTLEPGDLIATGTPSGVAPLRDGDVCEVEVEGVGILRNPVRLREEI